MKSHERRAVHGCEMCWVRKYEETGEVLCTSPVSFSLKLDAWFPKKHHALTKYLKYFS